MLYIILLISFVLFYTFGAIVGVKQTREKLKADIVEAARVEYYKVVTFGQWIPVIALLLVLAFSDIALADIGFTLPSFQLNPVITAIVLGAATLWTAYLLYMIIASLSSAKHRQRQNELLAKDASSNDYYNLVTSKLMTPRTKKEKRWWLPLSLSAGICEEVIFRGTFVFLVASIFPDISVYLVWIIVVALFGLFHLYQGLKGFVVTTLAGTFLTLVYIVSGTLIFVIALHFLIDYAIAFRYSEGDTKHQA